MYRVVLWGLGEGYNSFVTLRGYEGVEIVAIVDKRGGVLQKHRWYTRVSSEGICIV